MSGRKVWEIALFCGIIMSLSSFLKSATVSRHDIPGQLSREGSSFFQSQETGFLRLSDLNQELYRQALSAIENEKWETALSYLDRISDIKSKEDYLFLYVRVLQSLGKDEEVVSFINKLPDKLKIRLFDTLVETYILAALKCECYDEISGFIELQRNYYPGKIHETYKKTLYSLLSSGKYSQVISLTDVFPSNIYLRGEKNFILGVAHYNLGYITIASSFMQNALDTDSDILKQAIYEYLSLIAYKSSDLSLIQGNEEDKIPLTEINEKTKFNFVLLLLEIGLIDEANLMLLQIDDPLFKSLLNLFIAWESGHYRTAQTLFQSLTEIESDDYALLLLIAGEVLYHTRQYRDAVPKFRGYLSFQNIDEKYANHALALSFKGFYRFNSTAYYWIKNLETGKSVYDSLAALNLAKLYTYTENHHTAQQYFDHYLRKYPIPEEDQVFVSNYLTNLKKTENIIKLENKYDLYEYHLTVEQKRAILSYLGDYHLDAGNQELAIEYYSRLLQYDDGYQTILTIERIKFSLGEYRDSEDFVLSFIDNYPESPLNIRLAHDLAKFYLNQRRYRTTLDFIDDFLRGLPEGESSDSLYFFSALAHKELQEVQEALGIFIELHKHTTSPDIREQSVQQIKSILINQDAKESINYLVDLLEKTEDARQNQDYLRILAKVYEKAHLYREANEIYLILLDEDEQSDELGLYYSIAVNEIYQKRYESALHYLQRILAEEKNSHTSDALFLSYLANYSLDNHYTALRQLIILYHDYPDSPKRFEVLKNIIDLLIEKGLDLFAWYYLSDYYPRANQTEQFGLEAYKQSLERSLSIGEFDLKQLISFRRLLEITIDGLEHYEN